LCLGLFLIRIEFFESIGLDARIGKQKFRWNKREKWIMMKDEDDNGNDNDNDDDDD
jgi:hypothetical protein